MKAVTIIDVAEKAQLSVKTVSRALNDEPHVSPATKARALEAAKALNYQPNRFAQRLRGSRSYQVCLVYSSIRIPYVMDLQEGVLSRCEADGFYLLSFPATNSDPGAADRVCRFIDRSKVDGLILYPPLSDNKMLIKRVKELPVEYVRISQRPMRGTDARIYSNEAGISADVVRHLIGLGHERIALIEGPPEHGGSKDRSEGFRLALREAGISVPNYLVKRGDFSFKSGIECASALLAFKRPPTAIFASNDSMAAGVITSALDKGLRIPDELSVVGFDDAPIASQIWPALTTVHQPIRELGRVAADRLLDKIRKKPVSDTLPPLECRLVVRASTGPCPRQ